MDHRSKDETSPGTDMIVSEFNVRSIGWTAWRLILLSKPPGRVGYDMTRGGFLVFTVLYITLTQRFHFIILILASTMLLPLRILLTAAVVGRLASAQTTVTATNWVSRRRI